MIREIRSHPKIILGIFAFCCSMFVGEIFIRYWLYPREVMTEVVEEGPTFVTLLRKNLDIEGDNMYLKRDMSLFLLDNIKMSNFKF